ncbi:MarR family winged helix-turn-helix transcriptional regulator [Aquipuribacter nitratireducens]|uniref:MarR family winged helix-turn-helix transcriptional regulator n=1 Tax=Aquipuribacter nitratireducens TaxID=650104 RepID=A0ABW0GML1_9MICO
MTTVPHSRAAREGGTGALSADLRVALMRIVRRLRAEKSDADITDSQYAVLGLLDVKGPMTAASLAALERIRPPSMTRIVGSLLEAGLVERAAHPDDGRAQLVALTPAGREAVAETRRRRDEWLCRQLSQLSTEDRRTLARAAELLQGLSES